ncbi:DUF4440 domain-containing protein [Vibrio sp. qd031]|uniref:nuclear transport factor 2 family protein n=1 Tax=Vibrio sp. qd031 TaxID=1603038 RepID=UPI0015554542|nr:DUF4440 domain-containing protein [Vibrio sp. qd031]
MDLEKLIIEKELSLLTFEVRHSESALKSLLSSEFLEVGASGDYFGLPEVLNELPIQNNWKCHAQDFEFRKLDENIAQLIFRAHITTRDNVVGAYSRRTSIWRLEVDGWKMVYHQGTKVDKFELKP